MKKHKFKIWKLILLLLVILLIITTSVIFFRFKDYYVCGTVKREFNGKLLIVLDKSTTYQTLGDPGNQVFLFYKDISKFKKGDEVRAICGPFVDDSDPPTVDAYWIF